MQNSVDIEEDKMNESWELESHQRTNIGRYMHPINRRYNHLGEKTKG